MGYRAGTVNVTKNSPLVTGTGTQWADAKYGVMAGTIFNGPDGRVYEIKSIANNGNMTLFDGYKGDTAANQTYSIFTTYPGDLSQFAAQFNSLLAYYQLTRSDMIKVLAGTGNVNVTRDDGTVVTVPSIGSADNLRTNIGLKDAVMRGQFGIGGVLDLRGSPLIGPPSAIFNKGTVFGFCDGKSVDLPGYIYVTLVLNGSWENETGITGISRVAIANGEVLCQQAIDDKKWSKWSLGWNSINAPAPLLEGTDQWITGEKLFRRNGPAFVIQRITANEASYILAKDEIGNNRWFIGNGSDNDVVSLYNYKSDVGVNLHSDGNLNLAAPKKMTFNGVEVMTVGYHGFSGNGGNIDIQNSEQLADFFRSEPSRITRNDQETIFQKAYSAGILLKTHDTWAYFCADPFGKAVQVSCGTSTAAYVHNLRTDRNTTVGSDGAIFVASPVVKIFSDGSFSTNDDASGVNVERLNEGVYKITGCQGMNADPTWSGIDGGVKNPRCRNDKALLWNNYKVNGDGSIIVYTFHRVHRDAMSFAQNRLTLDKEPYDEEKGHTPDVEWPDQAPIDVPKGMFIQVRVNMPESAEPKPPMMSRNVSD